MNDRKVDIFFGFCMGIGIAGIICTILIFSTFDKKDFLDNRVKTLMKEAVDKNFAEYNSTNGVWQWKDR